MIGLPAYHVSLQALECSLLFAFLGLLMECQLTIVHESIAMMLFLDPVEEFHTLRFGGKSDDDAMHVLKNYIRRHHPLLSVFIIILSLFFYSVALFTFT